MAYTWGADGLAAQRIVGESKSRYYQYGPQLETRQVTDELGAVSNSYLYTAYGVPVAETGTDRNQHRYGGKVGYYTDDLMGMILATYRWYSPELMRWLSRDPIEYEGGDNLYRYVSGNPVGFVDPDGKVPVAIPLCLANPLCRTVVMAAGTAVAGLAVGAVIRTQQEMSEGGLVPPYVTPMDTGGTTIDTRPSLCFGKRGNSDPIPFPPMVNPGKLPNGDCRPCPDDPDEWIAQGDAHGSTGGSHKHRYKYNQNPKTCECRSSRQFWNERRGRWK